MEKQFKRGAKPYLAPSQVKNILKGVKYSEMELDPINNYLRVNNLTYTQLVKKAIKVFIESNN
jgi:ABC-type Zn2+ transport system substrate-binding protein/surface adhesin